MATWIKESERKRQLIEMLLKQAGYKLEGKMYVNNDIESAFGVLEIFPEESPTPLAQEDVSQLKLWIEFQIADCEKQEELHGKKERIRSRRAAYREVLNKINSLAGAAHGQQEDQLTVEDYKEVIEDHRRLVRELDVLLNGQDAAQNPSLCDILGQMKKSEHSIPDIDSCIEGLRQLYEKIQHPDYESVDEVMILDSIELLKKMRFKPLPSNIVEQLERDNPYPESVFIEPTSAEYKAVSRMFKKHGYSQDAFMGAFGRKVHTNAVSKLRELIKQQPPQGNAEDQDDDDELEDKIVNIMCESIEQDSDYSLRGTEEAARKIIKLFKNK